MAGERGTGEDGTGDHRDELVENKEGDEGGECCPRCLARARSFLIFLVLVGDGVGKPPKFGEEGPGLGLMPEIRSNIRKVSLVVGLAGPW